MKNKQISCTSRHHSFYNPVCSVKKCPKSHDATQKNVLMWCISMYHMIGLKQTCGIENVSLKVAKKICGCRGLLGRVVLGLLFSPQKPQQQWKTKNTEILFESVLGNKYSEESVQKLLEICLFIAFQSLNKGDRITSGKASSPVISLLS